MTTVTKTIAAKATMKATRVDVVTGHFQARGGAVASAQTTPPTPCSTSSTYPDKGA